MTVSELRKKLKGINGKLPVYIADHDHGEYDVNSIANQVFIVNRDEMSNWDKKNEDQSQRDNPKKYLVIRP